MELSDKDFKTNKHMSCKEKKTKRIAYTKLIQKKLRNQIQKLNKIRVAINKK